MDHPPIPEAEMKNLTFLRRLVTVLTAVMILGLLTVVALLVIRLQTPGPKPLPLPSEITLPDGTTATAVTRGADWYAIVTSADEILIYDIESNTLQQRLQITVKP